MKSGEKTNDDSQIASSKKAYRELLEERAANQGTVIITRNGISVLVTARSLLNELDTSEAVNELTTEQ